MSKYYVRGPSLGCWSARGETLLLLNSKHYHQIHECPLYDSIRDPSNVQSSQSSWNVTPCSLVKVHRRFEGIHCLCFLLGSCRLIPSKWTQRAPPKRLWTSTKLHDVTSPKIALVTVIAVRTSNHSQSTALRSLLILSFIMGLRTLSYWIFRENSVGMKFPRNPKLKCTSP